MLQRLFAGKSSLLKLQRFQDDLRSVRERPDELTRSRRTAHLAALTALLSVGLMTMIFAGFAPGFMECFSSFLVMHMRTHMSQNVAALDAGETAAALTSPTPFERARVALQLEHDAALIERLNENAAEDRRRHEAHLQALSGTIRTQELVMEQAAEEQSGRNLHINGDLREFAEHLAQPSHSQITEQGVQWAATVLIPILILVWPITWVVWDFLTRGGLNFRIMSLRLVGWDGQPAARWRCAWRALLVWTPLTALLLLSTYLEATYWQRWMQQAAEPWMLWASSACWWLGVALLLGYGVLALWFPARGLHDRLSGTYVVPD